MPLYKFIGNRLSTFVENRLLNTALSEFHSGYRAYSVAVLRTIPFERNSNGFHFDTEITIRLVLSGKRTEEVPIPTYYGDEICYVNGTKYVAACLKACLQARLQRACLFYDRRFDCAPSVAVDRYPSQLAFDSTHSRIIGLIPANSRILDQVCHGDHRVQTGGTIEPDFGADVPGRQWRAIDYSSFQ